MLIQCTNTICKIAFEFPLANGIENTFIDCNAICPKCGTINKIEDGTYSLGQKIRDIIKNFNAGDLINLKKVAEEVEINNGTIADLNTGLAAINPTYIKLFKKLIETSKDENFRYWVKTIIAVVIALIAGNTIGKIEVNIGNTYNQLPPTNQPYSKSYENNLRLNRLNKMKSNSPSINSTSKYKKGTNK